MKKKLNLSRETVTVLNPSTLDHVVGGDIGGQIGTRPNTGATTLTNTTMPPSGCLGPCNPNPTGPRTGGTVASAIGGCPTNPY